MKYVTLLLLLIVPLLTFANEKETFFHKGDYEQVKAQAAEEGKLFFIDFYADYCYACKLMDETTFVDEKLISYVKDNYIPLKVHIMDFDGVMLKEEYNINVLPTILIFNSKGELLKRYEEMLGPNKMMEELQKYDKPENRLSDNVQLVSGAPKPVFPQDIPTDFDQPTLSNQSAIQPTQSIVDSRINGHAIESQPTIEPVDAVDDANAEDINFGFAKPVEPKVEEATIAEMPQSKASKPATKKISTDRLNVSPKAQFASQTNEPAVPAPAAEGLFEFTVKPYPTNGFGVQIGVFAQYGNVLREVQKLQTHFSQPILVNISTLEGVPVYKIIVGSFDSRREAISFRRMMQKKAFDGVIKDLSSVKS